VDAGLATSQAVGDGTGVQPIYELLMQLKGLPFLGPAPHSLMRHVSAAEVAGRPAVTLNRVERVGAILQLLRSTAHSGFLVVSRGGGGGNGAYGAGGGGGASIDGSSGVLLQRSPPVACGQQQQQQQPPSMLAPSPPPPPLQQQQQLHERILGIVLRSQLAVLLRDRRCFQPTPHVSEVHHHTLTLTQLLP
jgi:CBS domain-containing protein